MRNSPAVAYNRLIGDRNRVAQAWSDVEVQLTRRHDLIPRLVEMVKGYAGYERALLTSLAELRTRGLTHPARAERGQLERSVGNGMGQLVALIEGYPDLKASENFLDLQRKLVDTENQIQFARRYNGAVNLLNNRIQSFPSLLVAALLALTLLACTHSLEQPSASCRSTRDPLYSIPLAANARYRALERKLEKELAANNPLFTAAPASQ